jgi:hypothetical protein
MQISEFRDTVSDNRVLSDLWTSHNQHGENVRQHGIAITDILARLLPALLGRIEQLQGSVNKFTSIVDTLALAAVAPAPSAARTQDEDDAARNTRPRTEIPQTVALPTTYVYIPPPLGPSPVAVSAPCRHHDASAHGDCTSCSTSRSTTLTVCYGSGTTGRT